MSLLDHAMNILGVASGNFTIAEIKSGFTVTRVQWDGCMATDRKEVDIGKVIKHMSSPHNNGKYRGVLVKYDGRGEQWEPLAHFRRVDGKLEVWT
jgi:hypothetical protein